MNATQKILIAAVLSTATVIATAQHTTTPSTSTAAPAAATSTGTPDLSGNYQCSGYDPYAKVNYTETISFKKSGDTYIVQLTHSGDVVPYDLGTAVANKDAPNAISYVYWDPRTPSTHGTQLFEIKSDGSLAGIWTSSGTKVTGTETCTKS